MSAGEISGEFIGFKDFQDYSIQCFDSIDEFVAYCELAKSKGSAELLQFLEEERGVIDNILRAGRRNPYGLKGTDKAPLSYQDALDRTDFLYKEEYEAVKTATKNIIDKELEKNSLANAMKDNMVFTERELGEFVYERASMSIKPNLFYYSFIHKREFSEDDVEFKFVGQEESYSYKKDGTEIKLCVKIAINPSEDGGAEEYEYYEAGKITDEDLEGFTKRGTMSVSSNVKKVYQFKEKQPRVRKAIKIFLSMTVGGFTAVSQYGDFYTGVTAVLLVQYLESRDYSVELVMVVGGGRCTGCLSSGYMLNTPTKYGRRFIGITIKKFDDQLDLDKLLYWACDPSAVKIKLLRYMNIFHWLYGDTMTTNSTYWHGIEKQDMICPVGIYYKKKDIKDGNKDLMYYFVHKVDDSVSVAQAVLDIVLMSENINYEINQKAINQLN